MTAYAGQHVWIVGAGDGIGEAIAWQLAAAGTMLTLSGRNEAKLRSLESQLPGVHNVLAFDVTDDAATWRAADVVATLALRLDRVIMLAGQYQPMSIEALDPVMSRAIVDTNLTGTLNLAAAILPHLLRQGSGQIALCGSLAGYRGLPHSQPYGATKAAIINLAESLRTEVAGRGIDVRLISPGFVRSRLTEKNDFHMPALMEPTAAAIEIVNGLDRSAFEIHFPRRLSWPLKLLGLLPRGLYVRLGVR